MKKRSIIVPIIMLVIGFATVSATLVINGVVGIGTNTNGFIDGVVFDEDSIRTVNNNITATVSASGRTISFITQELTNANDTATVYFKIKNYSQYNAKLGTPAISCYFVDNHQIDKKATSTSTTHDYVELLPGHELDGDKILGGGVELSEESYVTVRQKKSYVEDTAQEVKFQCEINATAEASDIEAVDKTPIYTVAFDANGGTAINATMSVKNGETYKELPTPTHNNADLTFDGWYTEDGEKIENGATVTKEANHTLTAHWMTPIGYKIVEDDNGTTDIGDEIAIGDEHFYIIKKDESKIEALAKYNVNMGQNRVPDAPFFIQNKDARGWINSSNRYGTLPFSKGNGWSASANPIQVVHYDYLSPGVSGDHGLDYTALDTLFYRYDPNLRNSIPRNQWHKLKLRLIDKSDIERLVGKKLSDGDNIKTLADEKGYPWLYEYAYWTETAYSTSDVWCVGSGTDEEGFEGVGYMGHADYQLSTKYGVRPVVTISNTYYLSFVNNAGAAISTKVTATYGEKYKNLPTPSMNDGYLFLGWYTKQDGGNQISNGDRVNITEDTVLYAHYANPGEWQKIYYDAPAFQLNDSDREEYLLDGWHASLPTPNETNDGTYIHRFKYWVKESDGSKVTEYIFEKQNLEDWQRDMHFIAEFETIEYDPCTDNPTMYPDRCKEQICATEPNMYPDLCKDIVCYSSNASMYPEMCRDVLCNSVNASMYPELCKDEICNGPNPSLYPDLCKDVVCSGPNASMYPDMCKDVVCSGPNASMYPDMCRDVICSGPSASMYPELCGGMGM